MSDEPDGLRPLLSEAYAAKWADEGLPNFADLQDRFVFHMADAAAEIRRLSDMLGDGSGPKADEFAAVLRRFFLHAVPHLVAAGQLYDHVPEIFPEQRGVHTLEEGTRDERYPETSPVGSAPA